MIPSALGVPGFFRGLIGFWGVSGGIAVQDLDTKF